MAIRGHKKKRPSQRQKVWDYMRRNRAYFKVSDILMLVSIQEEQLRRFFHTLEIAGYIEIVEKKSFKESTYKLIKMTGIIVPTVKGKSIVDYNTNETVDVRPYPVFLKIRRRALSLSQDGNEIKMKNFLDCGAESTIKKELVRLQELGALRTISNGWHGHIYRADRELLEALIKKEEEKRCLST